MIKELVEEAEQLYARRIREIEADYKASLIALQEERKQRCDEALSEYSESLEQIKGGDK